jgi:hypothetical protein
MEETEIHREKPPAALFYYYPMTYTQKIKLWLSYKTTQPDACSKSQIHNSDGGSLVYWRFEPPIRPPMRFTFVFNKNYYFNIDKS